MSNQEASSSQAVNNQDINTAETEPIPLNSVDILLESVSRRNVKDKFSPIYKVPSRLRDVNPSSFTPRVVSIGPMHKGRASLNLMEDNKATYMHELLNEVGSQKETLTKCEKKVSDSIEKIKRYYFGQHFEQDHEYTNDEFTRMMVMDACFILQFINKLSKDDDVLRKNRLRSRSVSVDLVLLENQIPFFVVQDIYDLTLKKIASKKSLIAMLHELLECVNPFYEKLKLSQVGESEVAKSKDKNLSGETSSHILGHESLEHVKSFFKKLKSFKAEKSQGEKTDDVESKVVNLTAGKTRYHILGLLHEFYKPESSKLPEIVPEIPTAHPAEELHKVGVRFRPNDSTTWPMDIVFEKSSHKPTLKMPKVLIDNFFEVAMRNLIAYEQYSYRVDNYVTSYAMAMDMLVATPGDIAKLAESNVIVNNLGSNEKASVMLSNICKDVTFPDFYYIETWTKAKRYYDSFLKKNWGVFKRKYFSTPWKAIALIAGIILFCLGIVQFVYRTITFASVH